MLRKKYRLRSDNTVAKKLGVSRSAVSRYRNQTGSIDDRLAVEIAEML
ncbi:MAG: helix-turn-helix domain-containing protein, partial [Paraglaciecola chathamensis]